MQAWVSQMSWASNTLDSATTGSGNALGVDNGFTDRAALAEGREFHEAFGVAIQSGPLAGVTARAVIVLDENDRVLHSERVAEIKNEPDYAAALAALA